MRLSNFAAPEQTQELSPTVILARSDVEDVIALEGLKLSLDLSVQGMAAEMKCIGTEYADIAALGLMIDDIRMRAENARRAMPTYTWAIKLRTTAGLKSVKKATAKATGNKPAKKVRKPSSCRQEEAKRRKMT